MFVVLQLRPWRENVGKRVVKSPKIYLTDTGIMHSLLGLETPRDLHRHPKLGASWEGFILAQVVRALGARRDESYFWATHAGAELDLLVVSGHKRFGFEFKRTDAPKVTPSMTSALESLGLQRVDVIHAGSRTYLLAPRIRAVAATHLLKEVKRLRSL
jgi:predicted AAA+ superfamily ATPase